MAQRDVVWTITRTRTSRVIGATSSGEAIRLLETSTDEGQVLLVSEITTVRAGEE